MTSITSIKARLKNLAVIENSTVQNELIMYGLERTLYRISISEYADRFTLKGGIYLYALFNRNFDRVTQDIDLLADRINNEADTIMSVFEKIFSIECDDGLYYDLSSIDVRNIAELRKYHGIRVSVITYLDRTKIPVSIDVGFGDAVYPKRVKIQFPALLDDMESPSMYAYSIYSVIAEKFEAIVSLGVINSRYKDFYDIYMIGNSMHIDRDELRSAIIETFTNRNTNMNDIVAFTDEFINNKINQTRWKAFIKKKQVKEEVSFEDVVQYCRDLLEPIL